MFLLKNGAIYCLTFHPYKSVYVHTRKTASVKLKTYRREIMKKKVTKTPKKTAAYACKVGVSKKEQKSVSCAAKATPIKASLESVIANPTILKKPNTPRLPAIGTTFIKKFKGKDLMIEVKSDGLYWEGKCYKSLSGLAMAITEYPISGYVFFHKKIAEWAAKKNPSQN